MQARILIAGPGRSGTTLLVKLLDALGFDTMSDRLSFFEEARAGLETNLLTPEAPHVVKDPTLTWRLRNMIESGQLDPKSIEWLVVPLRSLDMAAASRVKNTIEQRDIHAKGGLVGTSQPRKQREWLADATYGLFETAGLYELPLIVLEYPRFATDSAYAFRRLKPLLRACTHPDFDQIWHSVVDPTLLQSDRVELPRFVGGRVAVMRLRRGAAARLGAIRRRTLARGGR